MRELKNVCFIKKRIALATVTPMFTSCWTDKNSDNEKKTDGTEMNDSNVIVEDQIVEDTAATIEEEKAENATEAPEASEKDNSSTETK